MTGPFQGQEVKLLNDEALIAAIRRGDEAAIQTVITTYSKLLWSVAAPILSEVAAEADVEECVADVFIALWQHPERYDPQRGALRSYLALMARSRAVDKYRALVRQSALPLEDTLPAAAPSLADGVVEQEEQQALHQAVRTLEQPAREILLRRYYRDETPRQIAQAMDLPVKRVENCLYRAKRKLRDFLTRPTGG